MAGDHTFAALTAGGRQTCGVDDAGVAWCWGRNAEGQIGDGDDGKGNKYVPVVVAGGHSFTSLTAGGWHTCGIDSAGAGWCWGELAIGDGLPWGWGNFRYAPTAVTGGHTFTAFTTGEQHTCGLDSAGVAWCWGVNRNGQVGNGEENHGNEYAPVAVAGDLTYLQP